MSYTQGEWKAHTSPYLKFATVTIGDVAIEVRTRNSADDARLLAAAADLLAACRSQHSAIDQLMARLIELDPQFRPSTSACWPAVLEGNAAIAKATRTAA